MPRCLPGLIACILAVALVAGCGEPQQAPGNPYHHTEFGFRNPPDSPERNNWFERLPWVTNRLASFITQAVAAEPQDHVLPRKAALAGLSEHDGRNTVTWIGHMTAMLRLDGKTVLTDPWLTDHAGPLGTWGPKRYTPAAFGFDDLPQIDFVVISHSHYDHLDVPTIEQLPGREHITAVVPLKIGKFFREAGYGKVIELDWEESTDVDGMKFTALPVIHWSKRSVLATNDTLWAGFAIESPSGARVYFGGDAEYGRIYQQVAKRHGGFDLALLSIGAYLPRVVMNGSHCVPADCLKIGTDLGAHTHLGIHWGTIELGNDTVYQARDAFIAAGRAAGLPENRVWTMKIGETRVLPRRPTS
jgi:L-ascorbate metabolism protein UlaG (beta-lactamase superfamily)